MKGKILTVICAFISLLFVFSVCSCSADGLSVSLESLLTGETESPFTLSIRSPAYSSLAQFGEDRVDSLNRLLKHLSFSIDINGPVSETTFLIDQDPLFSFTEKNNGSFSERLYSIAPDDVFVQSGNDSLSNDGSTTFSLFLDQEFYPLNQALDALYTVFDRCSESFSELSKTTSTSLHFTGFGKGVRRVSILFPADYVESHFPDALADLSDSEICSQHIKNTVFRGSQKLVLLYDQEGKLLRINFDGTIGTSEASLSRISVVWKCLRSDGHRKDSITLKAPSASVPIRNNIVFQRDIDLTDPEKHSLFWELQADSKDGKQKYTTKYTGDLLFAQETLSGNIRYSCKNDVPEKSFTVVPHIVKENSGEYDGTLEITDYSGKIVTSSVKVRVCLGPSSGPVFQETDKTGFGDGSEMDSGISADDLQNQIIAVLIRKMMTLPTDDTSFLSQDIPEDIWMSLTESIF